MANYNGSLKAVECDIHSTRCDMVLVRSAGAAKYGFIRSLNTSGDADMVKESLSRANEASTLS